MIKMDKEKAREMLENYFGRDFPIFDEIIYSRFFDENTIEQYTFRGLIKIAYNLKDAD